LIFGVGRSGVAETYEAYGVSYAESRDRFREILDIVEQVELFLRGEIPPLQERHGRSQALPAADGDTSWSALAEQIRSYDEAWEEAGHPGKGKVFVSAPTYLAETNDAALAEPRASIMHFYQEQANLLEGAARLVDPETAARRMRRVEQLRNIDYDEALRTNALVGSPDTIVEKLRFLQEEIGLSGILAELNCGGLIPHDRVLAAMRLLCEAVKPRFAA
jgi:alkanesulfonate monooxygenase SsuD/methylene tetrahydromethanopterin reductase-like flavin-dependent oxidoreductase (luciferase family)